MAFFSKALKSIGGRAKKLLNKGSPKNVLGGFGAVTKGILGGGLLSKVKNVKSQAQLQQAGITEGAAQAGTVAPGVPSQAVAPNLAPKLGTQATDVAPAGQLGGVMDPAVAAAAEAERKRKKAQQIASAGPRTILGG